MADNINNNPSEITAKVGIQYTDTIILALYFRSLITLCRLRLFAFRST